MKNKLVKAIAGAVLAVGLAVGASAAPAYAGSAWRTPITCNAGVNYSFWNTNSVGYTWSIYKDGRYVKGGYLPPHSPVTSGYYYGGHGKYQLNTYVHGTGGVHSGSIRCTS